METLSHEIDALAGEIAFSGVVRVDRGAEIEHLAAYGLANRAYDVPNTVDTQFATASATKSLTAVTVASLVEDGKLELSTTARAFLGKDLPLIRDNVTIEQLLSHRSGIGDYMDEADDLDVDEYVLAVSPQRLETTEDFLPLLDGHETKFEPGTRFAYCNSGFVVLALIAERASGSAFHELVRTRVCEAAGMKDTAFLRADELPARAAVGYLGDGSSGRTNVLRLPVVGNGDGGIYTTAADVRAFWTALFAGRIVSRATVDELMRPRNEPPPNEYSYGFGFWLNTATGTVTMTGSDAGVSFRSQHDPVNDVTDMVISNTTTGAWPIAKLLRERAV